VCAGPAGFAQTVKGIRPGGMPAFDVTNMRQVITHEMGRELLVRVVKVLITKIIESPEAYVRENLCVNKPNS
jgi:hypothetical protein